MCGLFVIVGKRAAEVPSLSLERSLTALSRRGPDGQGTMRFSHCILGHTRLSIVDIASGSQPMKDGERDTAIAFNGEIYNYVELRHALENKGHRFRTRSDTEVILKAYAEYGENCVDRLDGMFAFALWDESKQSLYAARDRFGKKPLYYASDTRGNLIIASEIKALFALGIAGTIDVGSIDDYLALKYIPPSQSVYTNIHVVPPAKYVIAADGQLTIRSYWELPRTTISPSYADAKEEVRRLLRCAVRKRMVGEVEIASFLSGGVDSTLVTAYAQQASIRPLKTFSVGYGDYINELPFAREAADALATNYNSVQVTGDFVEGLENTLAYFDEPHADPSDVAQQILSASAARSVKVALSGDGADELFLGYSWYWNNWTADRAVHASENAVPVSYKQHIEDITIFPAALRGRLLLDLPARTNFIEKFTEPCFDHDIKKTSYFDISTYLPGQLLKKIDRAGMMHGLEVRCPFLDYRLAEFVFMLPETYKSEYGVGKIILKDILQEIMPTEFSFRKKQGFSAPIDRWLNEPGTRRYVVDKFKRGARLYNFLNEREVKNVVEDTFASRSRKGYFRLWSLLCLEIWLAHHS